MHSPIQLLDQKILRVYLDTREITGDSLELEFGHAINAMPQGDQEGTWLVKLDVQFKSGTNADAAPYIGEISVAGIFSLDPSFPAEKTEEMVYLNGGALLYGMARELLSSLTSRGIHGAILLPTLDARCFLPSTENNHEVDDPNETKSRR